MIRIHLCERGLEARRDQQVLEVLVAAVGQEFYNFFVCAHGANNLSLLERAGVVVVDHLENFTSRGQELSAELLVGRCRRALAPLALGSELLEALREAAGDGFVPARVRSHASPRRQGVDGVDGESLRVAPRTTGKHVEDAA